MTLNLTFTAEQLRGIAAARAAYNASLPEDSTDRKESDEAYLTFVILSASDSYASQYPA
jgi:hypothetical protein